LREQIQTQRTLAAAIAATLTLLSPKPARAETLPDALVRTYQGNPQLNAERARLRGIDETVPMGGPNMTARIAGGPMANHSKLRTQTQAKKAQRTTFWLRPVGVSEAAEPPSAFVQSF
jgi:outer membrane protein